MLIPTFKSPNSDAVVFPRCVKLLSLINIAVGLRMHEHLKVHPSYLTSGQF